MAIFRGWVRAIWLAAAVAQSCLAAAPAAKPVVVLIGLDGFRWDYLAKYRPPHLSRLAADGVQARRMIPSFPTLTFPNFYTLVTGLRPEHHGIVGNSMFDPVFKESFSLKDGGPTEGKWWGGEPLWVTAEKQGLRSACMFWPGSEARIAGVRPTSWLPYSDEFPIAARVQTVLDWLAQPPPQRPRLITMYFHEVDTASHRFGQDSPENAAAVAQVDDAIGKLMAGVRELGLDGIVNFIVVADHGMTGISPDRVVLLGDLVDLKSVQIDFAGAVTGLRPRQGHEEEVWKALAAGRRHFRLYRREDMPARLHFRAHRRIPPIVLVADEGWLVLKSPLPVEATKPPSRHGAHGFDPALRSMGATFIASGPAFQSGVRIAPFDNVEVYDLVCATLGLKPAPNDGTGLLVKKVLK